MSQPFRRLAWVVSLIVLVPAFARAQQPTEAQLIAAVEQQPTNVGRLLDLAKFYADNQKLAQARTELVAAIAILDARMHGPREILPEPPPPPPAASSVVVGPVPVGGDIRPPRMVKRVEPTYPPDAAASHTQGMVILQAVIDTKGAVKKATVIKHISPSLDQAALDAVRQWQYSPATQNGVPVEVTFTVTVNFQLGRGGVPGTVTKFVP